MQEKREFINDWLSGAYTVRHLCEHYGISRSLGQRILNRFRNQGDRGLEAISRAPHRIANKTSKEVELAICELRKKHPRWGSKKLLTILSSRFTHDELPARSTCDLILKRNGLVFVKKRKRRVVPVHPIFDPKECNEVWSADFKGKFRMGNRVYCHPLTIADSYSRFVFEAKGMYQPTFLETQAAFIVVFKKFGLPQQIHTDNGSPFGSVQAISRLTRLAVWFIELGIEPVYSDPAHPEQNGRHERMHRDLKGEVTRPPGYDLRAQQRKLNYFVKEYDEVRPHEALGNKTPSQVHQISPRPYPDEIKEWEYEKEFKVRYVCRNGAIRWGHRGWIGVSTCLSEKYIGLLELGNGIWEVYFRQKRIGYLDEKLMRIQDDEGRRKRNLV